MRRAGRLLGSVWLAVAACSAGQKPAPREVVVAPPRPPAPPPPIWDGLALALSWPPVSPEWFPSAGHGVGDWSVQILAAPTVAENYRALVPGGSVPLGSALVALHRDRVGAPGPVFAMLKGGDGHWAFVATDPQGRLDRAASLALCARCHGEAPADSLFGLPARTDSDAAGGAPP